MDCILDWIENRARLSPEKVAIVDGEENERWTYKQLNSRALKLANQLQSLGVKKGDRVALLAPNHIGYFDLLFASIKIGCIFVPLNWRLSKSEIDYILNDCKPNLVIYHSTLSSLMVGPWTDYSLCLDSEDYLHTSSTKLALQTIHEKDPLAIIYTGGTTGKPKGVVLSHQSIMWNGINTIMSWNLTKDDVTLTYLPMFHTGGLNALSVPILMMGGKVVIASNFNPDEAIRILNDERCTIILLVPTMYHMIIQSESFQNSSFPTVHTFLSGGAPCPLEIYEAFHHKRISFKEGYGLTEAGPNNFYMDPKEANIYRGSVGKPMMFNLIKIIKDDGQEADINEVGEVIIHGKHLFEYYWENRIATNEALKDGWLYTGDLGKRDEQGNYYIVGRKKEMIITGGENVYPLEVEQIIQAHEAVDEVAVVGLPDSKWGETVSAFLSVRKGFVLTAEEIKEYCKRKLGSYKIPRRIIILEHIPKTHVGKIDKKKLQQDYQGLKTE